jgi:hypothetical protein
MFVHSEWDEEKKINSSLQKFLAANLPGNSPGQMQVEAITDFIPILSADQALAAVGYGGYYSQPVFTVTWPLVASLPATFQIVAQYANGSSVVSGTHTPITFANDFSLPGVGFSGTLTAGVYKIVFTINNPGIAVLYMPTSDTLYSVVMTGDTLFGRYVGNGFNNVKYIYYGHLHNDGFTGVQAVNAAFSFTYSAIGSGIGAALAFPAKTYHFYNFGRGLFTHLGFLGNTTGTVFPGTGAGQSPGTALFTGYRIKVGPYNAPGIVQNPDQYQPLPIISQAV